MQLTTSALVLSALKYGDTSLIVKAYTASDGLKSYLLKGVLSSKKGKLKAAYFQPLTQLELTVVHKNKGTLERIKEVKLLHPYSTIHSDIVKNSLVLFLAEILANSIQGEEKDTALYQYLENAMLWLDQHDQVANFHLLFMINLTKYFGFYPEPPEGISNYFDLAEGEFITAPSLNPLLEKEPLHHFKMLLGTNFDGLNTIKIPKTQRRSLVQSLVLYFELHLHGFRKPKSLAVLNAVFD